MRGGFTLFWTGLERVASRVIPPEALAGLEYVFRPSVREPYGGPLNGQLVRQRIVLDLLRTLPISAIVETGTFRGSTSEFLATHSDVPVYTVELSPRFFHYSRLRLQRLHQVRVSLGDSREFLHRLAKEPTFPKRAVFFYLDAHWYDDLPLREEVELIFQRWKEAVIMIDDFEVPDDSGYGFDEYGPGRRLCIDYLPPLSTLGATSYFPAVPSDEETGLRRGCVVLADLGLAERLARVRLLRGGMSTHPTADRDHSG